MDYKLPMKASRVCTEQISIRVEPELKESVRKLTYLGVDVPELVRQCIRDAVQKGLEKIGDKAS